MARARDVTAPGRVLIVEHEAWRRAGHYMKELEALATSLRADGHDVHVLSSGPLAIAEEGRSLDGVTLHIAPRMLVRLERFGLRLRQRGARSALLRWPALLSSRLIEQPALLAGIIAAQRRLGMPPVVCTSRNLRFEWAALFAPKGSRWAVYQFGRPATPVGSARLWLSRRRSRLMQSRQQARHARGDSIRLVCNNDVVAQEWRRVHGWVDVDVVPLAGATRVQPVAKAKARATLALPDDEEVALVFGRMHGGRDMATVLLAFEGSDAPARLVVAGAGFESELHRVSTDHPRARFPNVTLHEGPQTDEQRRLLHSAADYVVLSFVGGRPDDSGCLADAVGYGLPVCCSAPSGSAPLVARCSLGLLYPAGDAGALRSAAVQMRQFKPDPDGRAAFLDERSAPRIARRLLEIAVASPR